MLRLSKRVEYGLIALQQLAKRGTVLTAREIADENGISYDLLAKIMQDLKRDGMVYSHQGVRGGYGLMLAPQQISVTRVVDALETENSITECTSETECCAREAVCTIKGPMHKLQEQVEQVLNSVTIAQLL
ncbi:MAG TPA: Rrf2 family transcriptional regulator [Candidatus Kapabacteria bacterium]|nr:Rrf2 family transcriptional regulator [Candidatus Kapabacteria bacterium]